MVCIPVNYSLGRSSVVEMHVSWLYMLVCVLVDPLQMSMVVSIMCYVVVCACCSPCLYWNTIHIDRHTEVGTPRIQDEEVLGT